MPSVFSLIKITRSSLSLKNKLYSASEDENASNASSLPNQPHLEKRSLLVTTYET